MPQEIRDKIGRKLKGIVRSEEFKQKNRDTHKGMNSGEKCNFIKYISEHRKGKTLKQEMILKYGEEEGTKHINEWIEKMQNAKIGKSLKESHKQNIGKALRGRKRTLVEKENIRLGWIKRKQKQQLKNLTNDSVD